MKNVSHNTACCPGAAVTGSTAYLAIQPKLGLLGKWLVGLTAHNTDRGFVTWVDINRSMENCPKCFGAAMAQAAPFLIERMKLLKIGKILNNRK